MIKKGFPLVLLALLTLSACTSTPPEETSITDEPGFQISCVPFYENLALAQQEDVTILDASGSVLLLHIHTNYLPDDPHYREEGYNAQTSHIMLYDYLLQDTLLTLDLPENHLCTHGFLWDETSFVYTAVHPDPESADARYTIFYYDGTENKAVTDGPCDLFGYGDPYVVPLGPSHFAYSYFDPHTNRFGVDLVSKEGEILPQLTLLNDGATQHLDTTLISNGSSYLYHAVVNGTNTIYVGAQDKIDSFSLPDTQRVYQFCFFSDDLLFFTMDVTGPDGNPAKSFVLKDTAGSDQLVSKAAPLWRIASNGNSSVLGVGDRYDPYLVSYTGPSGFQRTFLGDEIGSHPVHFYPISDTAYLAHTTPFDSSPALYLITLNETK